MTATPQTLIDTQPYVALDLEYNQPSGTMVIPPQDQGGEK